MENSKIQTQVITLGKLLIKELGLENSTDTLARWMAHYIAEKIVLIEKMPDEAEKALVEKDCYETILKLWEHRWSFPPESQPLKDFAPILKTLQKINPENESPFFYRPTNELLDNNTNSDFNDIKKNIELIAQIDKTARIWIDTILNQATSDASTDKTKEMLFSAIELPDSEDITVIQKMMGNINFGDTDSSGKKYHLESLKNRIKELENFSKLNDYLLTYYKREVAKITEND